MADKEYPYTYLYVYSKLRIRYGCNIIRYSQAKELIKRLFWNLPNRAFYPILREMVKYELLKKIGKNPGMFRIIYIKNYGKELKRREGDFLW